MGNVLDLPLFSGVPMQPSPEPEPKYPLAAGYKGPEGGPSHAAAQIITKQLGPLQRAILAAFKHSPNELTADEAAAASEIHILTARPRVTELHKLGLLEATDERRHSSIGTMSTVYKLTERGRIA